MARILVTGGAGFIGSHVVDALIERGDEPVVIDDLSTGRAENLAAAVDLQRVDIADGDAMIRAGVSLGRIDGIVHCAAQASVPASLADPERTMAVNVQGTANVLDIAAARYCPVVMASTAGVYGDTSVRPTPESAPIDPLSPYAASKVEGENLLRAHSADHGICRLANVYGPRQSGDGEAGVVAVFADRLRRGAEVTLYGHGTPTRDFVHVADVARGLLAALGAGGTWNIATGREITVQRVFDLACEALGVSVQPVLAPLRDGEIRESALDPARAASDLGWRATIAVDEGIPATIRALTA